MRSLSINKLLLVTLLACFVNKLDAQQAQVLSPYSAYGLGDIAPAMFAEQRAVGGVSLGVSDRLRFMPGYSASYADLAHTVFSTSMRSQFVTEETELAGVQKRSFAQFMGLGVAMPVRKGNWGIGFGLIPQTDVGYELSSLSSISGQEVEFNYSGTGGLNNMFVGAGKRVFFQQDSVKRITFENDTIMALRQQQLFIGAQMNYYFGSIGNSRRVIFPENQGYFNTNSTANVIIRDPGADLSARYKLRLVGSRKERLDDKLVVNGLDSVYEKQYKPTTRNWDITAGLYYGFNAKLSARRTDLTTSYFLTNLGVEITQDTVSFIDRAKGNITTPASIGFGLGFNMDDKLMVALEFRHQDWQDLEVNVEGWELPDALEARTSYSIGASWTPSTFTRINDQKEFWNQAILHAGARYTQDYLSINGSQLDGYAASAGVSLPLFGYRSGSKFTIGTELGSRGTVENGAIKEDYIEIFAGFSITPSFVFDPQWFKKRRIE